MVCLLGAIFVSIALSPYWINHHSINKHIRAYVENYINRAIPGSTVTIEGYETDVFNRTIFHNVTVLIKLNKNKTTRVTFDKLIITHPIQKLLNKEVIGEVLYGSSYLHYKVAIGDDISEKKISFKTNWIDLEELKYKFLRKLYPEIFKYIGFKGKLLINGEFIFTDKKASVNGMVKLSRVDVDLRAQNIKFKEVNGYIPFHEDFTGELSIDPHVGIIRIKELSYGKLKLKECRGFLTYNNFSIELDPLQCSFFGSELDGYAKIWYEKSIVCYDCTGVFYKLDFRQIKDIAGKEKFDASGYGAGEIILSGKGNYVKNISLKIDALQPGGTISAAFLKNILNYLPKGDLRNKVDLVLDKEHDFQFTKAMLRFAKKKDVYQAYLFLDGQHLLEFTINIDHEVIRDLLEIF